MMGPLWGDEPTREMLELDRLAEAELRRRQVPPYRPNLALIGCRLCGRPMYDDAGRYVHRWWWDWWRR